MSDYGVPPGVWLMLSRREREILVHLLQGRGPRRIVEATGRNPCTVRNETARMLKKLGAHSLLEAVAIVTGRAQAHADPR